MTAQDIFKELVISEDEVEDPEIIKNLKSSVDYIVYFNEIEQYFKDLREKVKLLSNLFDTRIKKLVDLKLQVIMSMSYEAE